MDNILSGIQYFFITLVTAVTTAVMVILPINKLHTSPTPTPVSIQEVKEATLSASPATEVKGISTKQNKVTPTPKPEILKSIPTITPTLVPSFAPPTYIYIPSPTSIPTITPQSSVSNIIYQQAKPDYSSYGITLGVTLNSLKSRLSAVQFQADQTPQNVDNQINSIDSRLQSDLATLERNYNAEIIATSNDFGRRGISGQLRDQTLQTITDNYNNARLSLINKTAEDKQWVFSDAKNKIYQADAQDNDLSNKIGVVEGLINKINSGTFTNSDIPLAIQAMSY